MTKTFIVTGANTGIGKITATTLAKDGHHVILACRSKDKTEAVLAEIKREVPAANVEFVPLDLGDLASVRACAQALLDRNIPIHGLINNAGLAGARGFTKSGFELAFGVNHVGHFLLTTLLLDRIRSAGKARIVTVASKAHYRAKTIDFDAVRKPTATRTALPEYGVAKLANVLFTAELARRLAGTGITTYSLHPGVVATDVWRSVPWPFRSLIKQFMITVDQGAETTLYCATSPACEAETGLYYDTSRSVEPGAAAKNGELAAELWRRSEEWVS